MRCCAAKAPPIAALILSFVSGRVVDFRVWRIARIGAVDGFKFQDRGISQRELVIVCCRDHALLRGKGSTHCRSDLVIRIGWDGVSNRRYQGCSNRQEIEDTVTDIRNDKRLALNIAGLYCQRGWVNGTIPETEIISRDCPEFAISKLHPDLII